MCMCTRVCINLCEYNRLRVWESKEDVNPQFYSDDAIIIDHVCYSDHSTYSLVDSDIAYPYDSLR